MGLETRERARLVGFHQAAVADHVGRENRREPAFDGRMFHELFASCGLDANLATVDGDDKCQDCAAGPGA